MRFIVCDRCGQLSPNIQTISTVLSRADVCVPCEQEWNKRQMSALAEFLVEEVKALGETVLGAANGFQIKRVKADG